GQARGDPARQGGLQGARVEAAQQGREGGGANGGPAGEAQRVSQGQAVVAAELGDGGGPPAAAEDGEGEDGGQGVGPAVAAARVGQLGEDLEQGQGGHGGLRSGSGSPPLYSIPPRSPMSNTAWGVPVDFGGRSVAAPEGLPLGAVHQRAQLYERRYV